MPAFDDQPELTGDVFYLRPLAAADRNALFAAASDPAIWAGHPARDRARRDVFDPYFDFLLRAGGALLVLDRKTGAVAGCSRFYAAEDAPEQIAIGFTFLTRAYWGGAANRELKRLMLTHAFATFREVWFHIDPTNIRSQRATEKIGAVHVGDADLDLAAGRTPWRRYRLTEAAWAAACA